jgi:hypothetical protein
VTRPGAQDAVPARVEVLAFARATLRR